MYDRTKPNQNLREDKVNIKEAYEENTVVKDMQTDREIRQKTKRLKHTE